MMNYITLKSCSLLVGMGDFANYGGWALDTQFVTTMGVPYLLAHGLGTPVSDAQTDIKFPKTGEYVAYVYTYNWVAPWKPEYAPGVFEIFVGGEKLKAPLDSQFGKVRTSWGWEKGGSIEISDLQTTLALHDLTGFEGRCGLVFFTQDADFTPPDEIDELIRFFKAMTNNEEYDLRETYDYIVAGAGISGMCSALAAARQGLRTLLVQDRPVVGGNNSSEVRVWLGGGIKYEPFPGVGNIVAEFEQEKAVNYGCENVAELYEDDRKLALLLGEKNLTLLTGHIVSDVFAEDMSIRSIEVFDVLKCRYKLFSAPLFADCTGDSTLGHLAGADYEVTTNGHMGMTNVWYVEDTGDTQKFPRCPWAMDLREVNFPGRSGVRDIYNQLGELSMGCWFWESGMEHDPIAKAEYARDTNFRAMYGAWDCLKNTDGSYKTYRLGHSSHIAGKRESRRLFGDVVLTKSEVYSGKIFEDACVPSTWNFDVHYPDPRFYAAFHEGDAFLTKDYHEKFKNPYFIPYRCLYSRNVKNLFMAGRNVSVSHEALGTVRVMRTCGMMGEVTGYAAKICNRHGVLPRDVYRDYLNEFIDMLKALPA